MKKILVTLSLFFSILQHKAFCQDTIYWSPDYKLNWNDFKAKPDLSSSFAAMSDCNINISYKYTPFKDSVSFNVSASFTKTKSWSKSKDNSILINHERGHFDIAELFARKFRKELRTYKFNMLTINNDIKVIFDRIWKEKTAFETLYDKETNHSTNIEKQTEWDKLIRTEINKLNEFK